MSITRTIGKNTVGDNNKMKVNLRTYNRSTHDQSYVWRNTQATGTIVPFLCEVALKGDTHEISLEANVLTHPTVGPLFGSFKLQMDVYSCPVRLYNAMLHNNALGIGLNMKKVKLPRITVTLDPTKDNVDKNEFSQINPSCIFSYLGLRGWGIPEGTASPIARKNAVPILAYWDIYKNYYANRQEENAYFIGNGTLIQSANYRDALGNIVYSTTDVLNIDWGVVKDYSIRYSPIVANPYLKLYNINTGIEKIVPATEIGTVTEEGGNTVVIKFKETIAYTAVREILNENTQTRLNKFPLKNIDDMRTSILQNTTGQFELNAGSYAPWGSLMQRDGSGLLKTRTKQYGLALKTYNSDIMQNWINTEWIDGTNGINAISAVSVTDGKFQIDALNLASKVYDMLNRIAVSGGSYKDWLDTVYAGGRDFHMNVETPVYEGGASQEIVFQEVISNAASGAEPLGSLAGRGKLAGKQKGGTIKVRTEEISYIIGLVSITPRIDYNQGNRFDTLLETLDDFHKPALDGIGFQDLITDKMAWWDTKITSQGIPTFKTAGKQPAWLDYMTNYNRTYGSFADTTDEGFMVLNRNYQRKGTGKNVTIGDLTTYIDPSKYNYIFADTRLDAMNFWVQIGVNIKTRKLISAKSIPNL